MNRLAALICGFVFGIGLVVSGMTSPAKVLGFLDVAGQWNPSLALVMGGGLLTAIPFYFAARRRGEALCGAELGEPEQTAIDKKLIGGSVLFGAGWGLAGICPGPALVSLVLQPVPAGVFVAAMTVGLLLSRSRSEA